MFPSCRIIILECFILSLVSCTSLFPFEQAQLRSSDLLVLKEASASTSHAPFTNASCKVFPGDVNWPTAAQWDALDKVTNGALTKTIPLATPCYPGELYDKTKCDLITAQWTNSSLHMEDPTSMMSPFQQGRTCEPPSIHASNNCTLGGYPSYVVNATRVADIQAAVNFARNTGVRFVIKNTGHDFLGKSGGAGSLSVWTHHLKDIDFISAFEGDSEDNYSGPAFKAGSGVQAFEIYEAAAKQNLVIIGGEGRTVGVMGGYILGGGHSPLGSIHGMAADQILSISLVTASGQFLTVDSRNSPDLFWALRGGGGSTFGIVTSITVKAYPDIPVTTCTLSFGGPGSNVTFPNYWVGIRAYFDHFIEHTDAGVYTYFWAIPISPDFPPLFEFVPFFAPNKSLEEAQALLKPWFTTLASLNITITPVFKTYSSFYPAWAEGFPQEAIGQDTGVSGSRLWPKQNWLNSSTLDATFAAWKESIEAGLMTINFNIAPTLKAGSVTEASNSVNPAWRYTVLHSIQNVAWAENATDAEIATQRQLLTDREAAWRNLSVGAGSYLGESDRNEVGFQQSFWGTNYARLLEIKKSVDPKGVFWAKTAVGSEGWDTRSPGPVGTENGPLCKV